MFNKVFNELTVTQLSDTVIVWAVPVCSLSGIMEACSASGSSFRSNDATKESFISTLEEAASTTTLLAVNPTELGRGGFKSAHKASILSSSPSGVLEAHFGSPKIVVKRFFFLDPKSGVTKRYAPLPEIKEILVECNVMYWAGALMVETYLFIDAYLEKHPKKAQKSHLEIFRLRFVAAGFGYVLSPEGSASSTTRLSFARIKEGKSLSPSVKMGYMLEELISGDGENGVEFVKYIHNMDPVPTDTLSNREHKIAVFLCFTQHVQFEITGGTAFLADYQGAMSMPNPCR